MSAFKTECNADKSTGSHNQSKWWQSSIKIEMTGLDTSHQMNWSWSPWFELSSPSVSFKPLMQSDSVHIQTHHPHACGQCHRGVDPWPQWPLVKAEVILVVGPQALGAILSQDLDGKARCNQALWGLPQVHVELLPQATQSEVDCFTAAVSAWWACIWGQGSASSPALVVGNFMRDVNTSVVDLIGRNYLIFWGRNREVKCWKKRRLT